MDKIPKAKILTMEQVEHLASLQHHQGYLLLLQRHREVLALLAEMALHTVDQHQGQVKHGLDGEPITITQTQTVSEQLFGYRGRELQMFDDEQFVKSAAKRYEKEKPKKKTKKKTNGPE
jgi:hypothetical protein